MDVKRVIRTKYGTIKFKGELSAEEHEYILGIGLNTLLEAGAFSMNASTEEDEDWPEDGETIQ